jgi:hypothetical protein
VTLPLAQLLVYGFGLDPAERRRATERALSAEGLRELEVVKPGAAVAAVLLADLSFRLRAATSVRPPG